MRFSLIASSFLLVSIIAEPIIQNNIPTEKSINSIENNQINTLAFNVEPKDKRKEKEDKVQEDNEDEEDEEDEDNEDDDKQVEKKNSKREVIKARIHELIHLIHEHQKKVLQLIGHYKFIFLEHSHPRLAAAIKKADIPGILRARKSKGKKDKSKLDESDFNLL